MSDTENIGGNTVNKISDITRQDIFDIIKDGFVEKTKSLYVALNMQMKIRYICRFTGDLMK